MSCITILTTPAPSAQPQPLVQHLDHVPEPWNVLRCERAIAQCGDFRGDPVLQIEMVTQGPQRVGQGGRRRVMAGQQENKQLITNLGVGQRLSRRRIGRGDQRVD
jgi:hypothetical protein